MSTTKQLLAQAERLFRHNRQGSYKTRERYAEAFNRFCRFIGDEFRVQKLTNIAPKHVRAYVEDMQQRGLSASTIKGKGGKIRTVPINDAGCSRLSVMLKVTPRGHKLFVPQGVPTYKAINTFQDFIREHRDEFRDEDNDFPLTCHGLRHSYAAEQIGRAHV